MPPDFRDVNPRELRVPASRAGGSALGMPPIWVFECSDRVLLITNGVTRAYRMAKLSPGQLVRVEVIGRLRRPHGTDPKIGDLLP
jgi:hypothetical protein